MRHVVVAQKRRTTDTPFGFLGDLLNLALRREGYTVYVLFGKSVRNEEFETLSGPCVELTPGEFKSAMKKLTPLLQPDQNDQEFDETFDKVAEEFTDLSNRPGCGLSAVVLNRNGKAEISFEGQLSDREAQDVASQILFFLRDVCHVHQHHAPTSDTILDVIPYDESDRAWKRETLYSLYRWVIQQKRTKNPEAYIDAKGVLAYARAFEEKHCSNNSASSGLPQYLREATMESIDAGLARAEIEEESKGRLTSAFFNRVVPLFGLVLAFLTPLYRPSASSGSTNQAVLVERFAQWVNDNFISVGATLALMVVLANVSFIFRGRIFGRRIWFDLFRSIYPAPYWLVISALFILTTSLLLLILERYIALTMLPLGFAP
ncbi:hypothetical protein [Pseudotabrizicola alkalilacus]|uniref:Uncharacterized protein n=1 Tax=Pseudotabrizicola alkalilacus TaxID=2305252 RepID=A0A411YY83_9RHOB|nr:hypothetical protein [Pseudotabrizicola alkalilacus]RGP35816.1 hypothetical protein D1012_17240 [Pseudotabrizicola alkalilacus]